jgi:hypothetical protein
MKKQTKIKEFAPNDKKHSHEKEFSPEDLGKRCKCYKCGTKFYDLGKPHPLCPTCSEDQNKDMSKGLNKRKKRFRLSFTRKEPSIHVLQEVTNDVEVVYILDIDDLVFEEHTGTSAD